MYSSNGDVGSNVMRLAGVANCIVFFFQAEDGIRDLVRSRGLGDVYKRQALDHDPHCGEPADLVLDAAVRLHAVLPQRYGTAPVSYTHLTLPTSDLV